MRVSVLVRRASCTAARADTGIAAAGPGDGDGDGFTDLLVGAIYYDPGARSGAGWLILGGTTLGGGELATEAGERQPPFAAACSIAPRNFSRAPPSTGVPCDGSRCSNGSSRILRRSSAGGLAWASHRGPRWWGV
ncbi:MAG: hypothetical protein EXR71_12615 [Myxococcales bacterium]|nr:hypothetical protein [Myxococcales bacterium]